MDIATQKLQIIQAILQCEDPKVLQTLANIIELQGQHLDISAKAATFPPQGQSARPVPEEQEAEMLDIQRDIDEVFNAF